MPTKLTEILDAIPSDSYQVGGESWNQIIKLLKGIDVSSEEEITINTPFKFHSGKLVFNDQSPTPTHTYTILVENIATGANRTITLRDPSNTDEFFVYEKQAQILEQKILHTGTKFSATADFQGFGADNLGPIKIQDSGDRNTVFVEPSNTTLNTYFDILPNYNTANHAGISTATDIKVRIGFGSEIDTYEFWSQADGSNSKILSITETLIDIPATTIDFHNSIVNNISLAKSQIPATVVHTDQANTFDDFAQTFRSGRLIIGDASYTHFYTIAGAELVASRTITLPLLTGNDTFVTQAFSQPLTNKSIDADTNTLTNIANAAIKASAAIDWSKINKSGSILDDLDDVVFTSVATQDIMIRNASNQWVNLAKGNNNEVLTLNNSGLLDWDTIDDANINASAAIAYSKLNLANSIVNADIVDNTIQSAKIVSLAWAKLTSVPSTFAPSAHAASHGDTGSDEIAIDWSQITTGIPSTFTPSAHNHAAGEITSGTLAVARGGLNKSSITEHALLKGGATNTYSEIAVGTEGHVLTVVSGTPAWAAPTGGGGGATDLDDLTDVDTTTVAPSTNDVLTFDGSEWVPAAPPGAGGGEANTTANVGTGGISIIPDNAKAGVVLNFKSMYAASNKISIVDGSTANDRVEFDIAEANLDISNMTGSIGDSRITDLAYTKLTSVPATFAPSAHNHSWAEVNKSGSILDDIEDVVLTTVASQDILLRNGSSQWVNLAKGSNNTLLGINGSGNLAYSLIGDANVSTHTSTKISITTKGQLNSQIAYKDETGWLTDGMVSTHTTSKISVTTKGLLNSAIVYNDQTNSFGDFNQVFKDNRLVINNPADTFAYTFVADAIGANRNILLPLLTGNDTMVTEAFSQPLTNKTIAASSNTISGIVDANIGSHTSSKITITTKGQLNSNIVYTDQANTFGDFDQIFRDNRLRINNPADTFAYTFIGAAIAADRSITLPLLIGNDTMVTQAFAQALTNKDIDADLNTITNIENADIKSAAAIDWSKINKSGSILDDLADVVITTVASQDIIIRNGSSQWVNLAKGSNNTLLGINGSGNLAYTTIGDANIASHTSTKITITTKGQLNSAIVYTDQTNTFGAFDQIFPSSRLILKDSGADHNYIFAGLNLAANRTITWPLLTADDVPVLEAFSQTLTNKTYNTTDNSLTATSQATGDILANNGSKFIRKARGTSLQVLRVNSGGTDIEWASLDSQRVGKSQANGGGSSFNIAHGLGATPTYVFCQLYSHAIAISYTWDGTNISVTTASATPSGTNNVLFVWTVIA